ncbi:MAG TPA: response regulator [Verrucomicrobiae bacterium]
MNHAKYQAVLLANDSKLAETVTHVLRLDGANVGCLGNYSQVLQTLQTAPPDILLLDLQSAETDSLNLLRQLKHHPLPAPLFTVALAARTELTPVLRAFELGLTEFVSVPFENSLFRARMRALIPLRQQITEAANRQRELSEAIRAAQSNSQAKSEFLAAMSHEIRTPMNGVVAMTALLMETSLSPEQRNYLETINASSESLLTIINEILDFSKIEAGKMELERRPFDLRACIEETLDLLAPRLLEKQVDLIYEADALIPAQIQGDVQRLRQVLVNIVGNAVKFTEHGDVLLKVDRLALPEGEAGALPNTLRLHFQVRDTGIGIQPDRLARLFRAFTQAEVSTSRKYGGTGLGLAISRRLVELMGGRMWAESEPGQGSTFHFTVNVTAVPDSVPPPHTNRVSRLADLKILILDDNATSRGVLHEQCRRWGMLPKAVETAAEAMDLLRGGEFDLALVDLHLREKDGLAVAADIQKLPSAAILPIVLLTPLGRKKKSHEETRVLFVHTVHKPVKPAQLCSALERALLSPRATHPPEPAKPETSLAAQIPLRILLVDDNAINQKVAVRILQQFGYEPAVAANGREALDQLDRRPFDFIFMDVMMPEMDGLEATRLLRKRQMVGNYANYQSRIIIVAMTAHAMQGDREKCLAAGMDDYLAKPIRPKDVRQMIERWGGKTLRESAVLAAAPPVNGAGAEPPVDMDRMKDLTDGNADGLRELVEMFLKQTHKQFEQMASAIREGKAEDVRRVAHSCAGASATLGMTHLVPKLRDLEKLGASGALPNAEKLCADALEEYLRVQEFLKTQPDLAPVVINFKPE